MAMVYIVTPKQLADLRNTMSSANMRQRLRNPPLQSFTEVSDEMIDDMWRSYNFELESWIQEIRKDGQHV